MAEPVELVASADEAGLRLDAFLAARGVSPSRGRAQALIRAGHVLVAGMAGKPSSRLAAGTVVSVWLPPTAEPPGVVPAPGLPVEILYADVALIAVNKPPGLVTHPAFGHDADTLVNALVARFPDLASAEEGDRPGIVHRLDRDTSGVMVVARTAAAADNLRAQFKARTTDKTYVALLRGALRPPEGVIDAPIARDPRHRQRMKAAHGGRDAQTAYRVLAEAGGYCWLEACPRSGRTHQIRVHLAAIGHPVAGDPLYGKRDPLIGRIALHAWRLALDHQTTGQRMLFEAPLPADLAAALEALGIEWGRR